MAQEWVYGVGDLDIFRVADDSSDCDHMARLASGGERQTDKQVELACSIDIIRK